MANTSTDDQADVQGTRMKDARIIATISFAHAVAHFFNLLLPPLFPWIKSTFALNWGQLGMLMTVYFAVSGVAQTPAGILVDRFGARYVLYAGLACLSVAAIILAGAHTYPILMLGMILAGLGNSVFHPADFTLLNQCVAQRRLGHAFSTHGLSGHLGWAVAPMFLMTIASFSGWRNALLAAAALPLLAWLMLLMLRHCLAPVVLPTSAASRSNGALLDFLKIPSVWACFGFFFISAIALGGIQSFATVGLQHLYAISVVWATTAFTCYMLGSASGMVIGGFLAARSLQHERIIACAFFAAALSSCLIASARLNAGLLAVFMASTGFAAGIAGPSRDFLIRQAAPKHAMGRVYGIVYAGLELGFACAPLLFAHLMDDKRPDLVFISIGICQVLAIFTAIGVKTSLSRAQLNEKSVPGLSQ